MCVGGGEMGRRHEYCNSYNKEGTVPEGLLVVPAVGHIGFRVEFFQPVCIYLYSSG